MLHKTPSRGFTIVELLIVIVIIGILASLVIVAYNGIQQRANDASRSADLSTYLKAITAARVNTNQSLVQITGGGWSIGPCTSTLSWANPTSTEPKDLPKTHICWTQYYNDLTNIGNAALMNLSGLRDGDPRGNPYTFDQNEGENGDFCRTDGSLAYFTGTGVATADYQAIPKYFPTC